MKAQHAILAVVSGTCLVLAAACSSSNGGSGFTGGNNAGGGSGDNGGGAAGGDNGGGGGPTFGGGGSGGSAGSGGCTGLQCQVHTCSGGGSTTISGTIYDPAGKNPLYDVVAYVPNSTPSAFKSGVSCDSCADLYTGDPIATALTDATGKFTITGAPDGTNIPLVIQIGKWRKQLTIANVAQCQDNPQPDKSLTLPKNHSEGDIPNIAISTGGADTLECLLRRVGVDAAEYGPGAGGSGHIHIFQGDGFFGGAPNTSPGAPDPATALWDSDNDINQFDIVILSCEGHETTSMNQQVLFDYAKAGGRVFGSHFHYAWFNTGPFGSANLATWSAGSNDMGNINANIVTTLSNGNPFPKGQALSQWLGTVNALTNNELPIQAARHNSDVGAANSASQAWIAADQTANPANATEYFTFDTPIGVPEAQQCGRVVFSDLHVGAASGDYAGNPIQITPGGCATNDLSPQEKALEFMLFDLSSCVTPNDQPPTPPPTVR